MSTFALGGRVVCAEIGLTLETSCRDVPTHVIFVSLGFIARLAARKGDLCGRVNNWTHCLNG